MSVFFLLVSGIGLSVLANYLVFAAMTRLFDHRIQ